MRSTVSRSSRGSARRSAPARCPIVILSSSSEDRDLINGYDLGAHSDVRKPVRFEELVTAIAQVGVY